MAFELLLALLVGHALADYPLQGDFLARGKNAAAPLPGVPWPTILLAHAAIHGGFVGYLTGSVWLGLAEFVVHAGIDHAKCTGRFGTGERAFNIDQGLHVACKVLWVLIAGANA
jgi:hypothetical protein